MKEIFDVIVHVNSTILASGKYRGLFYVALLYLFIRNRKKGNKLFYDAIAGLLLLWNPLFVSLGIILFPAFGEYWQMLFLLPQMGILVYGASAAYEELMGRLKGRESFKTLGICLLFGIIIASAGTWFPYRTQFPKAENAYGITEADREVLALLGEGGEVILLAPDSLMEAARQYDGDILTLYGRDLWTISLRGEKAGEDLYTPELYQLYDWMSKPEEYEKEIAERADMLGCTHLVFPVSEQETPAIEAQGYVLLETTAAYWLYGRAF